MEGEEEGPGCLFALLAAAVVAATAFGMLWSAARWEFRGWGPGLR